MRKTILFKLSLILVFVMILLTSTLAVTVQADNPAAAESVKPSFLSLLFRIELVMIVSFLIMQLGQAMREAQYSDAFSALIDAAIQHWKLLLIFLAVGVILSVMWYFTLNGF